MEPMLDDFRRVAETLTYLPPRIPVVSNLTGEPVTEFDADYWVRHVREPVRFADAMSHLESQGVTTYLELGPDAVLSAMGRECLADGGADAAFAALLRDGHDEERQTVTALGLAHAHGVAVDWDRFFDGRGARRTALPTYSFQRKRYWLDARKQPARATDRAPAAGHRRPPRRRRRTDPHRPDVHPVAAVAGRPRHRAASSSYPAPVSSNWPSAPGTRRAAPRSRN